MCGHGLSVGESINLVGGTSIGTVSVVQYNNNQKYDYALVEVTSNRVTLTNKVINASNYTTITSQLMNQPLVNTTICKYGKNTGFGTAKITSNNTTWTPKDGPALYGMVKCDMLNGATVIGGDSGGPIYVGHVFYGTISSQSSSDSTPYFMYSLVHGVTRFLVKTD